MREELYNRGLFPKRETKIWVIAHKSLAFHNPPFHAAKDLYKLGLFPTRKELCKIGLFPKKKTLQCLYHGWSGES